MWKMGKYLKIKKLWNLVVSKPENPNFRCNTAIKNEFELSRKKKSSFMADTKQQVVQISAEKNGGEFQ